MKKFKLKIIRINKFEKVLLSTLLFLTCLIYLIYPEKMSESYHYFKIVNPDIILNKFKFEGEEYRTVFNEEYATVICKNEDKYQSHIINLKTNKEVEIESILKNKEDFYNEIDRLLYKKFPSYLVEILKSEETEYLFNEDYLSIYYYGQYNKILNVSYENIKNFLNIEKNGLYFEEDGFELDPNKVTIALTFDDGPNGERTRTLIDNLEDYKMSATFFMVGYKLQNDEDTVKKVYNSHSEIGYHSLNHKYLTKQSVNEIKEDLNYTNEILKSIVGDEFHLTRSPYGATNEKVLSAIDMPIILWNVDTNDWRYKDVDYLVNHVVENAKDGSIVLFHDSYDTSVEAVLKLIKILYEKDIQVTNVSNLANLKNISLQSHTKYYSFSE